MNPHAGSPLLRWFPSLCSADRALAGEKGASLGELDRAGLRVPPGFVITTAAFERMVVALDCEQPVRARVRRLDTNDLPGVRTVCEEVSGHIERASFPPELERLLAAAYRDLGGAERNVPVAVRSSVTIPQGAEASVAGLQETYLWVRGIEGIVHAVRSCWASLYSEHSLRARLRWGIIGVQASMAVVVQRMVNAECSGVMYTRSPRTGDRTHADIEASWGLGSAVVGREVTPDRFIVSKTSGEIVERNVADKRLHHLPDFFAGGVRREPVPDELRAVACLTHRQIAELACVARRVERHFGAAQEVEWALASAEPGTCLLQSRAEPSGSGGHDGVAPGATLRAAIDRITFARGRGPAGAS